MTPEGSREGSQDASEEGSQAGSQEGRQRGRSEAATANPDVKVGIVGHGNVGKALNRGLKNAGNEPRVAGHDDEEVREVSDWADVLILAVPFQALTDVADTAGDLWAGKTIVDVTNVVSEDGGLAVGHTTSGAEQLQADVPDAEVVKAFNTVFAEHMDEGHLGTEELTLLAAGDSDEAKQAVLGLADAIGFDAVDAGPLENARLLEPMGYLNMQLGYGQGMGSDIGFKVVRG